MIEKLILCDTLHTWPTNPYGSWMKSLVHVRGDTCLVTNYLGSNDPMLSEEYWQYSLTKEWKHNYLYANLKVRNVVVLKEREIRE